MYYTTRTSPYVHVHAFKFTSNMMRWYDFPRQTSRVASLFKALQEPWRMARGPCENMYNLARLELFKPSTVGEVTKPLVNYFV
jgi:hypothetical protein